MTRTSRRHAVTARFRVRAPAVLLVVAALLATSYAAMSATARTTHGIAIGRGTWIAGHTDFVGYYLGDVGGRRVKIYCVSPQLGQPSRIALRTVRRVAGTSIQITRELAQTLSAHGNAHTAVQAEATSQALNTEIGNVAAVARRARYLPARVRDVAARYVAQARRAHGPYRLALHLPTSPLPGQSGVGTVQLRAAAGPIAGVVRLRHTGNVELPATVRVGRTGVARFAYRTVGGGPVHVAGAARVAPTTVQVSRTGAATQTMLTWSSARAVHAHASYQGRGPAFGHRYACTSECAGRPAVTLTACAPANGYASRITFWLGDLTHRIGFPAARTRACSRWAIRIADGTPVSATWQYRTRNGWTRPLPAAGDFTVDCPAAPPVAVAVSYDCATANLSATLGRQRGGALRPLHNTSVHRMTLVLSGAVTERIVVAPGATAPVYSVPVMCGSSATVLLRAGVQRASGGYNVGRPVSVTLP